MEKNYETISKADKHIASSSSVNDKTPLIGRKQRIKMSDKNIGISQQTLVSRSDDHRTSTNKLPQYMAGLASTLGALAAGMALGWTSPAELKLAKEYNISISKNEFSWIGSIFNLGAATICIPIGILTDIIGRKRAMLILVIPFTVGWALMIWSNSVIMFEVGRYILGVSGGAFCVTAPMYTGEIAENCIRGRLGSYFQLMLTIGILITYVVGSLVSVFTLSLISGIVPLIFFGLFSFMPESPTYYLKKRQVDAARDSYRWLRGSYYNVETELEEQKGAIEESNRNQIPFIIAIRSKVALKGILIAFGLMLFQQLSGVNAIIFYSGAIFNDVSGSSGKHSDTPTIIVGVIQVVAVFVSSLSVDRLGRRLLLLISSVAMCTTTFILGMYFYMQSIESNVNSISWLPLIAVCVFIILFSLGFGPIPWLMMGEIFSPQIKGIASSSACLFNWLMAFVVTKFYSDLNKIFGTHITFWIFSIICAIGVVFVYIFVPETKGKSLEQIQIELGGDTSSNFSA